jgi:hypothetical protein
MPPPRWKQGLTTGATLTRVRVSYARCRRRSAVILVTEVACRPWPDFSRWRSRSPH